MASRAHAAAAVFPFQAILWLCNTGKEKLQELREDTGSPELPWRSPSARTSSKALPMPCLMDLVVDLLSRSSELPVSSLCS